MIHFIPPRGAGEWFAIAMGLVALVLVRVALTPHVRAEEQLFGVARCSAPSRS